jgi:hypothetical protein
MAKREEEVILKLEVDQAGAEKELQRVESAILDSRKAMQDLNKSFKEGKVSQEDYVKESLKLQSNMKHEQELKRQTIKLLDTESNSRNAMRAKVAQLTKEYNNLNISTKEGQKRAADLEKQLKKLNDEINEGSKRAGNFKDNIGRYTQSIVEASKQITIHGTNVGGLISTLKSFANPVTAVIAGITALTAAYATSSVGARDYANATNQIGAAFEQAQNNYGKFIQSQTGSSGPSSGPLSRLAFLANQALFGTGAANQAKAIADAKDRIQLLERQRIVAQGEAKEAERLAEINRRVRDDENNSFKERLEAIRLINAQLERSAALRKALNNILVDAVKYASPDFVNDFEAQQKVLDLQRENLDIAEEVEGKKTENLMSEKAILELQRIIEDNRRRTARDRQFFRTDSTGNIDTTPDSTPQDNKEAISTELNKQAVMKASADVSRDVTNKIIADENKLNEIRKSFDKQRLAALEYTTEQAAALFSEASVAYKIFASAQTLISTFLSSQKAFESLVGIPIIGPTLAQAARVLAYANGIKTVAQINNVKFARGGYTGSGFGSPDSTGYKPAGVVHEHEYVVPKRLTTSATAQPHIAALESMRLRPYAAGGLVTNMATGSANEALTSRDAFRNIPTPVLDVSETMKVMKTIEQRERVSKLSRK